MKERARKKLCFCSRKKHRERGAEARALVRSGYTVFVFEAAAASLSVAETREHYERSTSQRRRKRETVELSEPDQRNLHNASGWTIVEVDPRQGRTTTALLSSPLPFSPFPSPPLLRRNYDR